MFSPDGRLAFVCSSFTPELAVIDAAAHRVVSRLPQASAFCPNIAVSPEGDEVWITLKDVGKVQVYSAKPPFEQKAVTIGGRNQVKVFRRGSPPQLVATIPVGELPHGIWPSGDGSRIYVALENAPAAVIDTLTNRAIANIPIGQTTQALVFVPDAVPTGAGTDNLMPLGEAGQSASVRLEGVGSAATRARGQAAVNSLGLLDLIQISATGLAPRSQYRVYLSESNHPPFRELQPLAVMKTNPDGAAIVQAIGPLKMLVNDAGPAGPPRRFVIVTESADASHAVLRQTAPDRH